MALSPSLNTKTLYTAVHHTLRHWHSLDQEVDPQINQLVLFQRYTPINNSLSFQPSLIGILSYCMDHLALQNEEDANLLRWRFVEHEIILKVARRLDLDKDQFMRRQRKAIQNLTAVLMKEELSARKEHIQTMEMVLKPPTYDRLFGVDEKLDALEQQLLSIAAPWVITISGIGGIGKSALADATVRRLLSQFHYQKMAWLKIPPSEDSSQSSHHTTTFDAIMRQLADHFCLAATSTEKRNLQVRQTLKAEPCLIVIDNLETEAELNSLLPYLLDLANPSKILLTSRSRPSGQWHLFNVPLDELPLTAVIQFIQQHARTIGLTELATATTAQLQPIYDLVGGNPLALKLIVSIAAIRPLADVLDDLTQLNSTQTEILYRHIYWQAWCTLSESSQKLLAVMPLAGGGNITTNQMETISRLSKKQLLAAVDELTARSLLEIHGTIWERRYAIHRLTETFVQNDIINWLGDS